MVKFIETYAIGHGKILLNIDKVAKFCPTEENRVYALICDKWIELNIDWETLKSMLGDNLITLNKDK